MLYFHRTVSDTADDLCRDCGKPLEKSGFFQKGETRVLGMPYCDSCVTARTFYCHTCRVPLKSEDFAEGKAVTLLGRRFCEDCLASAVRQGRDRAASNGSAVRSASRIVRAPEPTSDDSQDVETVAIRRQFGRYVPSADANLVVRAGGLLGAIRGNRVKLWLDVSEGGFRAIISGAFRLEEKLSGAISFKPDKSSFPFQAIVRHVRDSKRYPGCALIGAQFEKPSAELKSFIIGKLSGRPVMIPNAHPPSRPANTG